MANLEAAVSVRREAAQKLVEAGKRAHRDGAPNDAAQGFFKALDLIEKFDNNCVLKREGSEANNESHRYRRHANSPLCDFIASLGDYEVQSGVLLAVLHHLRLAQGLIWLSKITDQLGWAFKRVGEEDNEAVAKIPMSPPASTIRRVLNRINAERAGRVASFGMISATILGQCYELTGKDAWLDFNLGSITATFQDEEGPILVEIEYSCIRRWALDHGCILRIGTSRSAGFSEFRLVDLQSLCAAVEVLQRKAKVLECCRCRYPTDLGGVGQGGAPPLPE